MHIARNAPQVFYHEGHEGRTAADWASCPARTTVPNRKSQQAVLRAALVALCALLALTLQTAHGEPSAPGLAQASFRTFLPIVSLPAGPPATIRFGTEIVGGQLIGVATSFTFGRTALYYDVSVEGGAGLPYREEWSLNGQRRPELDRAGTLPPTSGVYASGIALSTSALLPRGVYQLRLFVGDLPSGVGQATIQ
ncbi:MAG: hypothetical protein WCG26_05745 [Chloroflexales bacterium]